MSDGKGPRITVSLSDRQKEWLEEEAEAVGLSQSGYVRMLVAKAMQSQAWMKEHFGPDMVKIVEALGEHPELAKVFER